MHEWAKAVLKSMGPELREQWLEFIASCEIKEFTRDGKRIIRILHRPSGKRVDQVRGADWQQSYGEAFERLMDGVVGPDHSS